MLSEIEKSKLVKGARIKFLPYNDAWEIKEVHPHGVVIALVDFSPHKHFESWIALEAGNYRLI